MAIARIQMRRGNEQDYDPAKMLPGEWAVSLDTKYVRMCFAPGECLRMATYEAFEQDMAKIEAILSEVETIEEAVIRINAEVSANADAVAEYTAQAKQYSDEAKTSATNAKASEVNAKTSETNAKASESNAKVSEENAQRVFESLPENYTELSRTFYNTAIKQTANGETIHTTDSADSKVVEFGLYGKAEQNGIPTPDAPVDIEVAGESYNLLENTSTSQTVNGIEFVVNEDKSVTVNGTATALAFINVGRFSFKENNKVILNGCPTGGNANTYNLYAYGTSFLGRDVGSGVEISAEQEADIRIMVASGVTVSNLTFYPMIRKASVKNDRYMPYGVGSIEVESVGKNRVNVNAEQGYPSNTSGANTTPRLFDDNTYVLGMAFSNYYAPSYVSDYRKTDTGFSMKMKGGYGVGFPLKDAKQLGEYTLNFDVSPAMSGHMTGIAYYDKNGNFVQGSKLTDNTAENTHFEKTFTIPEGAERCVLVIAGNTTEATQFTISNLQFEEGSVATEYQPYKEPTTALISTPNGLASVGGVYDEIIKYADGSGKSIKRFSLEKVDSMIGGYVGDKNSQFLGSYTLKNNAKYVGNTTVANALCTHFMVNSPYGLYDNTESAFCVLNETTLRFTAKGVTTLDALNSIFTSNDVYVLYELATPIITDLTAEEIAEIEKLHTFYPVTNISNDAGCGMTVTYLADAKNYIDNRLALIESAMINNI